MAAPLSAWPSLSRAQLVFSLSLDEWIRRYNDDNVAALIELANFLIACAGLPTSLDLEAFRWGGGAARAHPIHQRTPSPADAITPLHSPPPRCPPAPRTATLATTPVRLPAARDAPRARPPPLLPPLRAALDRSGEGMGDGQAAEDPLDALLTEESCQDLGTRRHPNPTAQPYRPTHPPCPSPPVLALS